MKIIKFRIRNYKSIKDSGDCYLTDTVTIIAGKNEAGKTAILEALEDFDTDRNIRDGAKPIKNPEALPSVTLTFEVSAEEMNGLMTDMGYEKAFDNPIKVEITKEYPDKYLLSGDSKELLGLADVSDVMATKRSIGTSYQRIQNIHQNVAQLGGALTEPSYDDLDAAVTSLTTFKEVTTPNLSQIADEKERSEFSSSIDDLIEEINKLKKLTAIDEAFLGQLKDTYIPYFILFNTFEDVFPNKIPFTELETNEWVKDLAVISDLQVETIRSSEDRMKHKLKKDVNVTLNDDYERFWTQDISRLSVDWDSDHLYFWIEEDGFPYEPSLRSKGRQWHLGFYIKVSARARGNVPNVILIDEPGLFLHAKAQKDILSKLEDAARQTQIIFSTHSPYLLESDKLSRIRLVYRTDKNGTKVENKVHALADKETLTPILTAIGLELSDGIGHVDKVKNVVVEGPSDLYYLQAFCRLLDSSDINFVFGGGSGNMPIVGTILNGWGGRVIYLYDNDQGKKDGSKNLRKNWLVPKELIVSVLDSRGSIEDLFTGEDFRRYVLNDENRSYQSSNSEYVKRRKLDKVLLAKQFLELVEQDDSVKLSPGSRKNITALFKKLDSALKHIISASS